MPGFTGGANRIDMHWTINVIGGCERSARRYELDEDAVRVGRDPKLEISLANADVSRLHFTLCAAGERVHVNDSSRNGTFVRIDGRWSRVRGTVAVDVPAQLRAGDWTFDVMTAKPRARPQAAALETEEASPWEESVMLPPRGRASAPEAIVVFDLCGSSSIASVDDHMAYHLKRRLTQLADPVLAAHGRRFFKSTGDGFVATFATADAALAAAAELEHRIQARNARTRNASIHYRIALHVGQVWAIHAGGDDIHGNDVNIAFRIEGVQLDAFERTQPRVPDRDRILCSRAFLAAASTERLKATLRGHVACGAARLKGIPDSVDIHWLLTDYSER